MTTLSDDQIRQARWSPDQWDDIATRAARLLVAEATATTPADDLVFLDLKQVEDLSTLSRTTIPRKMPVEKRDGRTVVRLSDYKRWAAKNPDAKPYSPA